MKKLLLLLCFILLFATVACADEPKVFSFRGVEFGMSQEQVLSTETAEMMGEPHWSLVYYRLEDMYGLMVNCKYHFSADNRLSDITLTLFVPKADDFKSKYNEILVDLLQKYKAEGGEPLYRFEKRYITDLAPMYIIKNTETFAPGIIVLLTSGEHESYNHRVIAIYFTAINNMDGTITGNFLEEYESKLKPVKQKELNKILDK